MTLSDHLLTEWLSHMANLWAEVEFDSERQRGIFEQLAFELKHGRGFADLKLHRNAHLNLIYLTVHRIESDCQVFIPLAPDQSLSLKVIANIQDHLLNLHQSSSITLAFIDEDSTTVFYRLTPGLVPPPSALPAEMEL